MEEVEWRTVLGPIFLRYQGKTIYARISRKFLKFNIRITIFKKYENILKLKTGQIGVALNPKIDVSNQWFSSVAQSCPTLQPHRLQHARLPWLQHASSLLKLRSIKLVMPSSHLILYRLLLLLPSIFPSIRVLSNESVLRIRWPKYWSFSFSISPPNEYSGLISFSIDSFDQVSGGR